MKLYLKNNKYYCRFTCGDKRIHRLCRGATSEKEALQIAKAIEFNETLKQLGMKPKEEKNVYFYRLKELYMKHAKTNHKKFHNQIYYLNALDKYFNKGKPVNKIKPEDIQNYIEYLKDEHHLKNSSINRFLEILSKMYNLAIDNNELTENPLKKVLKLPEDNHRIRFLSSDEERRLFESIELNAPFLKPIITTALQTGMRKGEILNLQWCNIDFDNRLIHLLDTKTNKSREIPISDELYPVLLCLPMPTPYVFTNPETNLPYVDIKKSWHKVLDHAQIKNFRFHDLRHTFATRLVMAGVDFLTTMEILGHTSLQTTMRYSHVVPGKKMEAIRKLSMYTYNTEEPNYETSYQI